MYVICDPVTVRMNEAKIPKSPSPPSPFWKISDRLRNLNLISASKERKNERTDERTGDGERKRERSYVAARAAAAGVTGICKLGSAADLAPLLSRSRRRRIKTKETEEANETNANGNFFFDEDRQTRLRGFLP